MQPKIRRRLALMLLAVLALLLARAAPLAIALCRSTDDFAMWPTDPRVRYEPGAEAMAAEVAAALPDAVRTVETRQFQPFLAPPTVFVCASLARFASFGGEPKSGGYVLHHRLFISPKPANTRERIPHLLKHELSHLHLEQRIGSLGMMALPFWFEEGLAALVSDSGGAEGVSEPVARQAILAGRTFAPVAAGRWFWRDYPSRYGLTPHLYYRESALFLDFLARRDAHAWQRFLTGVESGADLASAYAAAYGGTLDEAWSRFVASLEPHPAAKP